MTFHPDIQGELDRVVGNNKLPELTDRPSLPYVECNARCDAMESGDPIGWVLAFRTSVIHPSYVFSGVPHLLTSDDVYNGYHMPKNYITVVIISLA